MSSASFSLEPEQSARLQSPQSALTTAFATKPKGNDGSRSQSALASPPAARAPPSVSTGYYTPPTKRCTRRSERGADKPVPQLIQLPSIHFGSPASSGA